jgi:hypothetical protein
MQQSDISWSYTLDQVIKSQQTGLVKQIKYTYTGTYGDFVSSIRNNYANIQATDPTADGFIGIDDVSISDVERWVDASISEVVEFDIEIARCLDILPDMDEDDPRQPKNQDLTNFRHSSYKEQMQQTIYKTLLKQESNALVDQDIEHTF